MNKQIEELVKLIKEESPINCSSVNIFINSEETKIDYSIRDPKLLKSNAVSMKNINGKWIK